MLAVLCQRVLLAGLATTILGCAGWRRVALPSVPPEPRQQYQVWLGDTATVLHALRLTADSLSGVPYVQPPSCDPCRRTVPVSTVDSLRAGDLETAGFTIAGLPIFVMIILGVGFAASYGDD